MKTLTSILKTYDLNTTQFYQAWSRGELSQEALQVYANEYGNFIGQLAQGWKTLGDEAQAHVEEDHYDLWRDDFCRALKVEITNVTLPEINDLMETAEEMFSTKNEALGALYIFIAQQASTSESKIAGLRAHYSLPSSSETYFEAHLNSDVLASKLLTMIETLSPEDQASVVTAAGIFAQKLWNALEGIYEKYKTMDCLPVK